MKVLIEPATLSGTVAAIPSKSAVHRLLMAAALAEGLSELACPMVSEDMAATARCLIALGAAVKIGGSVMAVSSPVTAGGEALLDPGESGSTYRFFTPLAAALGRETRFRLHGKLPSRPMDPLWDEMERHGVAIDGKRTASPSLSGQLTSGRYRLRGDVSSQFFTGLLFALPLLDGESCIDAEGPLESAGYVDMTLEVLEKFSVQVIRKGNRFIVPGNQKYRTPGKLRAEGDWSNAAFWLCAGAARGAVDVTGLKFPTCQGDSAVMEFLRRFGARTSANGGVFRVASTDLHGAEVNVSATPDLVPALAVAAAAAHGTTHLTGAGRLRLKESDRIASVCGTLRALGGRAFSDGDSITVEGTGSLRGGCVDACGDHRIAMMGAAASVLCSSPVVIDGAEAVDKSYPTFFDDFAALGGTIRKEES
ncbi:MAG: 3-phosphoshikimate 1-carboxyvinyltransferase [Pyramidobacter sp.]|jgi:3-phosphoshikimate 1-carboxyvinyltransferase